MASRKPASPPSQEQLIDRLVEQESTGYAGLAAASIPEARVRWTVGDAARVGSLNKATVVRVIEDGRRLVLATEHHHPRLGQQAGLLIRPWFEVQQPGSVQPTTFAQTSDVRVDFQSSSVDDLLGKKFHMGMDDSPAYQRDLVWTPEENEALIDAMFHNVDIGKFLLIDLTFAENRASYEILDGKQRLNALVSFVGDRFAYQGVLFSQMSRGDRRFLEEYPVQVARFQESSLSWEQRLNLFLRVNTTGRPQSAEHLDHVRRLRDQAREADQLNTESRSSSRPGTRPSP